MSADPASLDRLHDIVAPPPVPSWPPAPGWYWLLAFASVVALAAALRAFFHWQRNRYRREALAEFVRQEANLGDPVRRPAAIAALAELLKRTALTAWPREEVASLTGSDWLAFLDRTGGTNGFSLGSGRFLEKVSCDPRTAAGIDEPALQELRRLLRRWLTHHRTGEVQGIVFPC